MKRAERYAREILRLTAGLPAAETAKVIDRFAAILIEKGQASLLPAVMAAVEEAPDSGETEVRVTTAAELPKEEGERLRQGLERELGPVALRAETDPSLLGGAVIRYGDVLFDGSVRRRLELLKQRLRSPELR